EAAVQVASLDPHLEALRGLGLEDDAVDVRAEVERRRLEGVAIVAVDPDRAVGTFPGEVAQAGDAAAAGDGAAGAARTDGDVFRDRGAGGTGGCRQGGRSAGRGGGSGEV